MPRYVLLEHRRDGVHWDFMLEDGPGLRTWALEAFPAEGAVIAARALPDHRPAYLDYEGPISGGRGEVRRRDRGTYRPLEWAEDRVRVALSGSQLVGEAELCRAGGAAAGRERTAWVFRLRKVD